MVRVLPPGSDHSLHGGRGSSSRLTDQHDALAPRHAGRIKLREGMIDGAGNVSTFGGHAWDAGLLLQAAIPVALKKAQPGTPAFRAALRDALEGVKELPAAHGVFSMSPTDHLGLDQRARVMVKIEGGTWKYQP